MGSRKLDESYEENGLKRGHMTFQPNSSVENETKCARKEKNKIRGQSRKKDPQAGGREVKSQLDSEREAKTAAREEYEKENEALEKSKGELKQAIAASKKLTLAETGLPSFPVIPEESYRPFLFMGGM